MTAQDKKLSQAVDIMLDLSNAIDFFSDESKIDKIKCKAERFIKDNTKPIFLK